MVFFQNSSGPAARSLRLGTHQKPCGFNGVFSHPGAPIFLVVLDGMVPAIFMGFYDILLGFIWVLYGFYLGFIWVLYGLYVMLLGSCSCFFFGTSWLILNGVFNVFFFMGLIG